MSKVPPKESILPPLWVMTLLFLALCIYVLFKIREIVMFLLIGYIIAFAINPVLRWLERRKLRREVGIVLFFTIVILFLILVVTTAIPPFVEDLNQFIDNLPAYSVTIRAKVLGWLQWIAVHLPKSGVSVDDMKERLLALPDVDAGAIRGILGGLFRFLLEGYSVTLTLVNLTILPFIVFYLSLDIEEFHQWVLQVIPPKSRKTWQRIFWEINNYVRAFVVGQTTVCTILFVLYCIGFRIVGLKQWFFLGVVSGFGNLVPYLGTILGILLSTTLSLVTYGTFNDVLLTWLVFIIVQFLEGFIITPKIVGDKVGLSPLLVILSILIGGKLFGILGILLAIPGAASLRVLANHIYQAVLKRIEA